MIKSNRPAEVIELFRNRWNIVGQIVREHRVGIEHLFIVRFTRLSVYEFSLLNSTLFNPNCLINAESVHQPEFHAERQQIMFWKMNFRNLIVQ